MPAPCTRFENLRMRPIECSLPCFTTDTFMAMSAIQAQNTVIRNAPAPIVAFFYRSEHLSRDMSAVLHDSEPYRIRRDACNDAAIGAGARRFLAVLAFLREFLHQVVNRNRRLYLCPQRADDGRPVESFPLADDDDILRMRFPRPLHLLS